MVEETSKTGSAVNEFESRTSTNKTDHIAQGDKASVVALWHDVALVLLKQCFGRHIDGCMERQQRVASVVYGDGKGLGQDIKDIWDIRGS